MVDLAECGLEFFEEPDGIEGFRQNPSHGQTHEPRVQFAMGRYYDDDARTVFGLHRMKRANDTDTVEPGHHQIDDERVDRLPFEHLECLDTVGCEHHVEIGHDEQIPHRIADIVVVVDDEHGTPS